MKKCLECDSERIVKNARLIDSMLSPTIIEVDADPEAWLNKGTHNSYIKVEVCADCGYVALYATEPEDLWSVYQRQEKKL